jgi:hypothetical protein
MYLIDETSVSVTKCHKIWYTGDTLLQYETETWRQWLNIKKLLNCGLT